MKGLDHIKRGRFDLTLDEDQGCWGHVNRLIDQLLELITPLKDQIKVIKSTQSKSILAIFEFIRSIV